MAKPRVFISSTFYDLKQTRADLDLFLDQLGYEPIRNEEGDIPYGKEDALEAYCYKEIENVDILISIIGGRYGSESKKHQESSVTQAEIRAALTAKKQVYLFIEKNVLSEYETYFINKGTEIKFRYVDDIKIYTFIEEIKGLSSNNNIKGFDSVSDITKYLKEQLAGLFQRFLQEQSRIHEVNLIKGLEKTSQTLNKLVNFLSEENKDKTEEINRILMINHPLTEFIKTHLKIKFNFYIEALDDLKSLFKAYGYEEEEIFGFNSSYSFTRIVNGTEYIFTITEDIFDDESKLKFCRRTDWNDEWVSFKIETLSNNDDDLPF